MRRTVGILVVVAVGALILQSALASQAVSVPDLLLYWRFDETASPATDSAGNGHSGTWEFSPVSSTSVPPVGPPGISFTNPNSLSFDGVNTRVTNSTFSHPVGGPVTVAFWNFVAAADVQASTAFTVGLEDNPNRFMAHAPYSDSNVYWDYGDWTNGGRITADYTAYLDKWTHIVMVSEGNGGLLKAIYLDGALVNSIASSDGPDTALSGLVVGHLSGAPAHKGLIDDFRIYGRVLSLTEITALHNGALPGAFTLTATGGTTVSLSWTASAGGAEYQVSRTPAGGGATTVLTTQTGTTFVDTTGSAGTTYDYTVTATNVLGETSASAQAAFSGSASAGALDGGGGEGDEDSCGCSSISLGHPTLFMLGGLTLLAALFLMGSTRNRRFSS